MPGEGFYPRPRAGGDAIPASVAFAVRVSIHAPVQGATSVWRLPDPLPVVSIHAPVQGATGTCRRDPRCSAVSIHAPVQGATHSLPRSRSRDMFLSTPPCRGRPVALRRPHRGASFYPRPRAGGDSGVMRSASQQEVSIHAPVQGATPSPLIYCSHTENPRQSANPRSLSAGIHRHAAYVAERVVRPLDVRCANLPEKSWSLPVRAQQTPWRCDQTISGPSRSNAGLAPTCSTRLRPSAPRR